jgi:Protein of unknown function (DUF4241)
MRIQRGNVPYFPEYALELINTNREGISRRIAGSVNLPSGRLVACDPWLIDEEPFSRIVQPGRYLVELCVTSERDIAAAIVRFGSSEVTKLEMALTEKQVLSELEHNEFYGYGVDRALGCFTSIECAVLFKQSESAREEFQSQIETEFFLNYRLRDNSSLNLIAFTSGDGDGTYPSYWGLGKKGKAICLFTDFMVLNEDRHEYIGF